MQTTMHRLSRGLRRQIEFVLNGTLRARATTFLAAGCLVAAWGAAPAAAQTTPASGLGINGWYLFWEMPQSTWNANVAAMAADGIKVVRTDALWSNVEPTAPGKTGPSYQWATTDAIMKVLATNGIQWLPIIDYTTPWNESTAGNMQSAPSDVNAYAQYAAAVVSRYGKGGSFWLQNPTVPYEPVTAVEIWNEPNVSTSAVAPATYAAMYSQARIAIHNVNSSVQAIVGGLGNPGSAYLSQVQQTLGKGKLDAVAAHPYDASPAAVLGDVNNLRTWLNANGDASTPIDVTEFGWPTAGTETYAPTLTDSQRGIDLYYAVADLAQSGDNVERIIPYSWVTAQQNANDANDWFGITNAGAATTSSEDLSAAYQSLESSQGVPVQSVPASAGTVLNATTTSTTTTPTTTTKTTTTSVAQPKKR